MQTAPDSNPPNETVSQSEIEKLLAQLGAGEALPTTPGAPTSSAAAANDALQRHDFPQATFFSAGELRKLRMRHEDFINSLAAALSFRLGMEISMQMSKLETSPFQAFVDSLTNPTNLAVLKLDPLQGNCLLDVPTRLALCLVDRELGGSGVWQDEPRELTKMETGLLSRVVESILSEWCGIWSDVLDLRPVCIACENSGRFLQTCTPNTMMLVLGIEVQMGGVMEQLQLGLSYPTLEPLMLKLNAAAENGQKPPADRAAKKIKWNPALDDMPLQVTAELPGVEVDARQLANLKLGDVIRIPVETTGQVQVCLEGMSKFVGVLGKINQKWAVQIAQIQTNALPQER